MRQVGVKRPPIFSNVAGLCYYARILSDTIVHQQVFRTLHSLLSNIQHSLQEHPQEPSVDTYITVKGRILIPAKVRRLLGIKEGTRIQVDVDEQTRRVILTPITHEYIQSLRGKYKGKGLLKALAVEKNRAKNAC